MHAQELIMSKSVDTSLKVIKVVDMHRILESLPNQIARKKILRPDVPFDRHEKELD